MTRLLHAWSRPLLFCLLLCAGALSACAGGLPAAAGSGYSITGVVVSERDGSPVPFALLHATPSASGVRLSARTQGLGDGRNRPAGARGGGDDVPGGRGGGGRNRQAGTPVDEASTTADGSGRFHMEIPHAGRWTLTATAHGFGTQRFEEHDTFFASIVLNESVTTYSLTFHLTPGAAFTGVVLDEAGEPIERAQVTAELLPKREADSPEDAQVRTVGFAQTDDRGRYELTRLDPGQYRIKVVAAPWYTQGGRAGGGFNFGGGGFQIGQSPPATQAPSPDPSLDLVYAPTWYPGTADAAAAEQLTLHAGEEREADLQLTATQAVHLEVSLPTPAAGETRGRNNNILITRVASSGFDFATQVQPTSGTTGRSGALSPGLYQVRHNGFDPGGDGEDDVREIEIPPGASGTVTLDNARPLVKMAVAFDGGGADGNSSGEVAFIDTVTGRRITASGGSRPRYRRDDTSAAPATPAERSVYLPPGRYAVYLQFSTQDYVTSLTAEGAKIEGRFITVTDGKPRLTVHTASGRGELGGIVQTAAPAGSQTGKDLPVTAPVEGAMVVLVPVTLGQPGGLAIPYRDESNTDGSFDLAGVVPGKYILIAVDHGWALDIHDPVALAKYLMHGVPIEVAGGSHLERRIEAQTP